MNTVHNATMCKLIRRRQVWKQREQLGIVAMFWVRNKCQSSMNYSTSKRNGKKKLRRY